MAIFNRNGSGATLEKLFQEVEVLGADNAFLRESLAELQLGLEDQEWTRMGWESNLEFSRDGLQKIVEKSRVMYLKNPLIQRAVEARSYYVWGQGVELRARDAKVNEVLQAFTDARGNRKAIFGHQARDERERDLETEGNLFFALFPREDAGVDVRRLPFDDIRDIITNPDDKDETWFFLRKWSDTRGNNRSALYPQVWYQPDMKPPTVEVHGDKVEVRWGSPVYHVRVGGLSSMRFGLPETFAALDWARAYKEFLEDWSTLVRALSRFAWRMTVKGRKIKDAKNKLATTLGLDSSEKNPPPVAGAAFIAAEGTDMTPIPKTGAHTSAEDGRQLRLMVASAMHLPDQILSSDPSMGSLATAKTLDRPTELAMRDRQSLWADIYRDLFEYVVAHAISKGKLQRSVDTHIDVDFPSLLEHDVDASVRALVNAATLGGKPQAGLIPKKELARMLLTALSAQNIDHIVAQVVDEKPPTEPPTEPPPEVAQ